MTKHELSGVLGKNTSIGGVNWPSNAKAGPLDIITRPASDAAAVKELKRFIRVSPSEFPPQAACPIIKRHRLYRRI
jgi:hypothetical protein